jgi:ribosomal protein S21
MPKELRKRRHYEKPTVRRKRVRRELNIIRFKELVRRKAGLVLQMKIR